MMSLILMCAVPWDITINGVEPWSEFKTDYPECKNKPLQTNFSNNSQSTTWQNFTKLKHSQAPFEIC